MTLITEANYAEEALLSMKSRLPNPDGTIGVTVTDLSPAWMPWLCYFLGKRMDRRASFMRSRARDGYMVPTESPAEFDPTGISAARDEFAYRLRNGEITNPARPGMPAEMTASERDAIAERAKAAVQFKPQKSAKYTAPDPREAQPKLPEPRELTEAEANSMRRLMGKPEFHNEEAAE